MVPLSDGETLAHYRIRAQLGAGGMGEVYLADDQRLHRPVALKLLTSGDLDRFVFEARAASALNHPNVAHIYEIAQLGDVVYIAMEYVEGETLEKRLERGPLPPDEVREIAVQLADALAEAHAKGIVHRDLKPANIVINPRGQAKILDFGIAKRISSDDVRTTKEGVVGTLPYMSPEQLRGQTVDHRSDLFSFGVMLYEMVTGRRPFDGEGILETVQRIADFEPEPIPGDLGRVIAKCLRKLPPDRYASAREIVEELRGVPGKKAAALPPHSKTVLVLFVLLVPFALFVLFRDKPESPSRLAKITSSAGLEDEPSISPDGKLVAYTSDERGNLDIFVRTVTGGEAVRITDSDADDAQPAWSPDGSRLAFVSSRARSGRLSIVLGQALGNFVTAQGGDLYVVPAKGGAATRLVENAFYPSWSPDGNWIVFQSARGGRWDLWKIPANGGAPVQLTNDRQFDFQPSWSPDGKSIVFCSGDPGQYRLKVIAANGGNARVITDGKDAVLLKPVFTPDGKDVIYTSMRGGSLNLWRSSATKSRPPERVTLGEGGDLHPSISADGSRLVYATIQQTPDLWSLEVATGKLTQLSFDTGREEHPHRRSDGTIAFTSDRGGVEAIWLMDPGGQMRTFVAKFAAGQPRWSPDGKRIAFRFSENDLTTIAVQATGSVEMRIITREAETPSWSPDGRYLAYTAWSDQMPNGQIYVVRSDLSQPARRITSLFHLINSYPSFSPDGKFVAFQATQSDGTRHIWMVEVASGSTLQLTSGPSEDSHPHWSPVNADEILFVRNHENLMTVSVSSGEVRALTKYTQSNTVLDYPSWSADGTRVDFSIARKRGDLYMLEKE